MLPIEVEGLKGHRFVVTEDLGYLAKAEREIRDGTPPGGAEPAVAFLAPLDPFVWDRDLLRRLFCFDYIWEVYVPEPKRRWGYYVLPILYGDRLVGRIEPRIERRAGDLRVAGMWWEDGFEPLDEPGFTAALADALLAHRDFADLSTISLPRTGRHRPVATALRAALALRDAGPRRAAVGRCSTRQSTARSRPKPTPKSNPEEAPNG